MEVSTCSVALYPLPSRCLRFCMRVMLAGPAGNYVVWCGPSRRAGLLHPDPERPFHLWKRRLIVLGALSGRLMQTGPRPRGWQDGPIFQAGRDEPAVLAIQRSIPGGY